MEAVTMIKAAALAAQNKNNIGKILTIAGTTHFNLDGIRAGNERIFAGGSFAIAGYL